MKEQRLFWGIEKIFQFQKIIEERNIKKILLVCGQIYNDIRVKEILQKINCSFVHFSDFIPNPEFHSVIEGVRMYRETGCEAIMALGGGSTLDGAQCIKRYAYVSKAELYSNEVIEENQIILFAIPTTAGTGSESTCFAVIYQDEIKYSVEHKSLLYDYILFDEKLLDTLSLYQRKSTMLDALCHAVESCWSINSNMESKKYAEKAIKLILRNRSNYIIEKSNYAVNKEMFLAANLAGKAINITKTTAGHALCYEMTVLYKFAHGHAAALCVYAVWKYMIKHLEQCIDKRGRDYLEKQLLRISEWFGGNKLEDGPNMFLEILKNIELERKIIEKNDKRKLVESVNIERLKNTPIYLDESDLYNIIECLCMM